MGIFYRDLRGVQKIEEPNKPTKLCPKFWFGFGAVRFTEMKIEIFSFGSKNKSPN